MKITAGAKRRNARICATVFLWLIISSSAWSAQIAFSTQNLSSGRFQYDYVLTNDSAQRIDEVTIYFDRTLFNDLANGVSPSGWDPLVIQPDLGLPSDGFFDVLALGPGLLPGVSLSGFSIQFTFLGSGSLPAQRFQIVEPDTFAILASGLTVLADSPPPPIPEPATFTLFIIALLALVIAKRRNSELLGSCRRRKKGIALLFASILATFSISASAAPLITNLTLVSETRVGRSTSDYVYKITIQNDSTNWSDLRVTLISVGTGTSIVDGNIIVGRVPSNQLLSAPDTITLRQDRTISFNPKALQWKFSEAAPPATGAILLPGLSSLPAIAATFDHSTTSKGIPMSEVSVDIDGTNVPRTLIRVEFLDDATVGQINASLASVSGGITDMLAGSPYIVVRIPDSGTIAGLNAVLSKLKASQGIGDATKAGRIAPKVLPPAITVPPTPTGTSSLDTIKHHLAIRAHAAWNVADNFLFGGKLNSPPSLFVWDIYGATAPSIPNGYALSTNSSNFNSAGPPNRHGYHVLGILGATWGDRGAGGRIPPAGIAGLVPAPGISVTALDDSSGTYLDNLAGFTALVIAAKGTTGPLVFNTSMGYPCNKDATLHKSEAAAWIGHVRAAGLENRALFVTAAGNIDAPDRKPCAWTDDNASRASPAAAAALATGLVTAKGLPISNLNNVFVVENAIAGGRNFVSKGGGILPVCTAESSVTGPRASKSVVSGIGTDVYSLTYEGDSNPLINGTALCPACTETNDVRIDTGTSMATPQVAGLAIWLWTLKPTLSVTELKDVIYGQNITLPATTDSSQNTSVTNEKCRAAAPTSMAQVVDAYASTLALDKSESGDIRTALFDVATSDHKSVDLKLGNLPNNQFDEADIRLFVQKFISAKGSVYDYSRYDLNGDGRTGEVITASGQGRSFDLNTNGALEGTVTRAIEGVNVTFDERGLSDAQILCYYAYSPSLYKGDTFERTILMLPIIDQCGVKLSEVKVVFSGVVSGYSFPFSTTLASLNPPINPWRGFYSGTGTCGSEQGGPLWSSNVTLGAYFIAANIVLNPPLSLTFTNNRRPCSSFFAVHDGKVWLNATARGQTFSQFGSTDREHQGRYFSDPKYGTASSPIAGRASSLRFEVGTANVPFGNFGGIPVSSPSVSIAFTFVRI